jgi:hypothetical protein
MGAASVIVGLLGFVCALTSAFVFTVPKAGVALSVVALMLSLASIVLGGVGMSQASDKGESSALPMTGLIIGIISFMVSFVLAMTCGSCNACLTVIDSQMDGGLSFAPPPIDFDEDASVKPPVAIDDAGKPPSGSFTQPPPQPQPIAPATTDAGLVAPPPAFPPPPMHHLRPRGTP